MRSSQVRLVSKITLRSLAVCSSTSSLPMKVRLGVTQESEKGDLL